jgi:hypothetical protein
MSGTYLSSGAVAPQLAAARIDVRQIERQETVQPVEVLQYMTDAFSTAAESGRVTHKGSNGCIGVLGGCSEATGPPHFAAMSALRAGVDIARIFTTVSAAASIRCYSPDTYVHPVCKESSDLPEPHTPEQHAFEVAKAVAEVLLALLLLPLRTRFKFCMHIIKAVGRWVPYDVHVLVAVLAVH